MNKTTNIFVHMNVDPSRLEQMRALPNVNVDVIELEDDEEVEHWHLPDERCADTHILVDCIPPDNLDEMHALKLLQISTAGYTQVTGHGLDQRGIRVCNGAGEYDIPIAEWNLMMMINLLRDMRGMIRNQESQIWDRAKRFQTELAGHTVGIWGYGGIGRETARLCKAMNLMVHVMTREGVKPRTNIYCVPGHGDVEGVLPDVIFTAGQEQQFLGSLDFLILAMPLTPSTKGILGEAQLNMLPSHAFILNPARGPLIEEQALLAALRDGTIAGAALDTHYHYPLPPTHPLWHFPNVILTPHISGSNLSQYFKTRLWDIILENTRRFISDRPLLNELSQRQLSEKQ